MKVIFTSAFALFFSFFASAQTGPASPVLLRCNYWENPSGIDVPQPDLSWNIQAGTGRRGMYQTAYQILVASSPERLQQNEGNRWNAGKVESSDMLQIRYAGKELVSGRQYWWKVKIWDEKGTASAWSRWDC